MDRVSKFKFLSTEFLKIKHKFEFDLKEFYCQIQRCLGILKEWTEHKYKTTNS